MDWPFHVCPVSSSETLAEVTGLSTALLRKDHIRILPGKWRWSQEEQWPPIQCVLECKFWKEEVYKTVRDPLRQAIPTPDVIVGGEFVTIDTKAKEAPPAGEAEGSAPAASAAEEPQDLGTEVIREGSDSDSDHGSAQCPSPMPSPAKPTQAEPKEEIKTGLIHVLGMQPGSFFPATLRDLPYCLTVLEVSDEDSGAGVHSMVARLLNLEERMVVAVIGDPIAVQDAQAAIQRDIVREQLKVSQIAIHTAAQDNPPWQFNVQHLLLISRSWPKFKACHPSISCL